MAHTLHVHVHIATSTYAVAVCSEWAGFLLRQSVNQPVSCSVLNWELQERGACYMYKSIVQVNEWMAVVCARALLNKLSHIMHN